MCRLPVAYVSGLQSSLNITYRLAEPQQGSFSTAEPLQLWLLGARPIAARASTVSGMRVVYDKEGIDPDNSFFSSSSRGMWVSGAEYGLGVSEFI